MECGPSFENFCMSLLRNKKMGIAYGYHTQIDQIQNLINDLKTNPDSRRLMVNAWNVADLPVTDYRTDDELYQDYLKNFE
jgi:thymidylate synthase